MMYLATAVNDRDTNIIPNLISLFTRSGCYHDELVFSDGSAAVVTREIRGMLTRKYSWYKWILIPLPMITFEDEQAIRKCAADIFATNPGYDYLGALLGWALPHIGSKRRWYCSELCYTLLKPYISELTCSHGFITPDSMCRQVSDIVEIEYPDYHPGLVQPTSMGN